MTHHRNPATSRRPVSISGPRTAAAVAATAFVLGVTGCGSSAGSGNATPSASPSETPSAAATTKSADDSVLSGNTDPGSVAVFSKRELCVNASDFYYVLTNFSAEPTATAEPDAAFVKAAIGRAKNLSDTLARQVPPEQVGNAEGASQTWRVVDREARQRGYQTDDLTGFFDDLEAQVKAYVPGNGALTQYLSDTCATQVPDFGTALAPPT